MKKPEMLCTVTVGQTREKYHENEKALANILNAVYTGVWEEGKGIAGEWVLNQTITELLIQQEYIRERERANWGWDKEDIDFSRDENNVIIGHKIA